MTNQNQSEGLSPQEFFESEWYRDGLKQLCVDGWPTFVIPVNIQVSKLISDYDKLKEENQRLRAALTWSLTDRAGLSSKYLVSKFFNIEGAEFYYPLDKGDRGRCIRAIKSIDGLEAFLESMKQESGWDSQVFLIKAELND